MGISASKRVTRIFSDSSEFDSACDLVFNELVSITQHSFPGILPYQLSDAADRLHHRLSLSFPVVKRWAPSPPSQAQVDRSYRSLHRAQVQAQQAALGPSEFKAFAVELFTDAVVSSAGKEMASKVPIGVAGIAGIGMVARVNGNLIGAAIGVYALGVATSVYLSLAN